MGKVDVPTGLIFSLEGITVMVGTTGNFKQ